MADPTAGVKRATDPAARPVVPGQTAADTLPCTMRELLLYFLRLGTFGFGGPIALAGYMQRDLVEERRGPRSHRPERLPGGTYGRRPGPDPDRALRHQRRHHRLDGKGDHLDLLRLRLRGAAGEGLAPVGGGHRFLRSDCMALQRSAR